MVPCGAHQLFYPLPRCRMPDCDTAKVPACTSNSCATSTSMLFMKPWKPIPSRYPVAFRHPVRGNMSSRGSSPFVFSRATATPQSKSISTPNRMTRIALETMTASSSPSGASPTSSVPSPQDSQHQVLSPLQQRLVLRPRPDKRLRGTVSSCVSQSIGSGVLQESGREDEHPSHSG